MLDAHPTAGEAPIGRFLCAREFPSSRLPGRHDDLDLLQGESQEAQILEQPTARRQGVGVASARRLSWVLPTLVSLRKRIVSAALIRSTFLTVWHFFLPLS
jgi:hypothetical protein